MREGKSMEPLFAFRPSLFVHFIIKNPPTGEASGERRITKSAETSQAPVDRCTRTSLLPLLPSGPGGIHKIALRGTSARLLNITFCVTPCRTQEARASSTPAALGAAKNNGKIKKPHAAKNRFCSPARHPWHSEPRNFDARWGARI